MTSPSGMTTWQLFREPLFITLARTIVIELIAHTALHLRGRPSFYNGLG